MNAGKGRSITETEIGDSSAGGAARGNGSAYLERPLAGAPSAPFADRGPVPLPRDGLGRQQTKGAIFSTPTPRFASLRSTYGTAIAAIRQVLPLRAARLEDLMDRVDEALERYRALRVEEETRQNLLAGRHHEERERVEAEIRALTEELKRTEAETDGPVRERLAAWETARQQAAWICASVGETLHVPGLEEMLDPMPERADAEPKAPEAGQAHAEPAEPERRGLARFVPAFLRRERPAASAEPERERADAPEPKPAGPPPFDPEATARAEARSEAAIAAELGLPYPSAVHHGAQGETRLERIASGALYFVAIVIPRLLALCALGSIFGLSIGLICGVANPKLIEDQLVQAGVCAGLGIFAFWGMGKVASMLSGLASEGLMHDAFASDLEAKLRRQAKTAFWAMLFVGVVLIAIETGVEYKGVLGSLARQREKTFSARVDTRSGPAPLEAAGILLVCAAISGPFILYHVTEGWNEARARAIRNRIHAVREREVFERAEALRAEYFARWPRFGERLEARDLRLESAAAEPVPVTVEANGNGHGPVLEANGNGHIYEANGNGHGPAVSLANGAAMLPVSETAVATAERPVVAPEEIVLPAVQEAPSHEAMSAGEVTPVHVAVAKERLYQAARDLREARNRQFEALRPIRQRLGEADGRRAALFSSAGTDSVSVRRLEDAYVDYIGATQTFDAEYRAVIDLMERVSRRRASRAWWQDIMRRFLHTEVAEEETVTRIKG